MRPWSSNVGFRSALRAAVVFPLLVAGGPAGAHVLADGDDPAGAWPVTPDIAIPLLLLAALYLAGLRRRRDAGQPPSRLRHLGFFGGLAALFLALQSPVDALAGELFFVHQIQHLLLRMIGPMLLALSAPQALLVAGLPSFLRRQLLAPLAGASVPRRLIAPLLGPLPVTLLFIGSLYFWQIPYLHELALRRAGVHYTMHISMLAAGLLFWWRIFDLRPPPQGLRFGARAAMLCFVILSNILLGASTTFTGGILYPAYGDGGLHFGYTPLADQQMGGITIWIPSSMMSVLAALIVIHRFGRDETRRMLRALAGRGGRPTVTAPSDLSRSNRRLALGFAAFALTAFLGAFAVGILYGMVGG